MRVSFMTDKLYFKVDKMSLTIENINYDAFKNICRMCTVDSDLKFYLDHALSNIFLRLTDLHFETNDELPQQVCLKCYEKIYEFHVLSLQCKETHSKLMACLNNFKKIQLKEENEELPENANRITKNELIINLEERVTANEKNYLINTQNIEIDEITKLDEGIIPETSDINEHVMDIANLHETSYNLKEEIKIEEHKIEFVNAEYIFHEESEIKNEQNIESDYDLFASNTSNIISGSDKDPDYNYTSSDDSDSVSNNENSDVSTENLNFSYISNDSHIVISKKSNKKDSKEKEEKQSKTPESNDCIRSFKCTKCSKSFTCSDRLRLHMRMHTGERPFKCDQCSKSFNYSSTLKLHMLLHSEERPFKCDQCSKSFISSNYMKIHMRTHSGERPFKCDQCSKSFKHLYYMKTHMRTHTGERPFKCDQCSKAFSRSCHMKTHMRIHTGERPFKCDECSKSFNELSNLKKHKRTHINKKKCNV